MEKDTLINKIEQDAKRKSPEKQSNYEWLVDDELTGEKDVVAKEIMGEVYSKGYESPIRVYDNKLKADKKYICLLYTSDAADE